MFGNKGPPTDQSTSLIKQTGIDISQILAEHQVDTDHGANFTNPCSPELEDDSETVHKGSTAENADNNHVEFARSSSNESLRLLSRTIEVAFSRRRPSWGALIIGQVLSVILCLSAITSTYLVKTYNLRISNAQNFLFYVTLSSIFTSLLACRPNDSNLLPILKSRGWKYALVALCDAEANYLVVKAYQFTTLTSVQLLDCFTIPTVLVLSCLLLKIRYKLIHFVGVLICLLGVGCLVWADITNGIPLGQGDDRLLGDLLCLSGAFLYGVSNVAQEFFVKTFDTVEFLGMIGLFGSLVTGVQTVWLETSQVTVAVLEGPSTPIVLLAGFVLAQLSFYILAAVLMKLSSATMYNLSILTADFYSLLAGIYLFQYSFQTLYFSSFACVIIGVIVYSIQPPTTATRS